MSVKGDRAKPRTPLDVERKYNFEKIDPTAEEVEKLKEERVVDDALSATSTNAVQNKVITENLNLKVSKEAGKGLSSNDFTDEYKDKIDENAGSSHTHDNKELLNSYSQTEEDLKSAVDNNHTHTNKDVLDGISSDDIAIWNGMTTATTYNLSDYAVDGLTILRSSCIDKNGRVCINFVGTLSMEANTTTALFNLPSELYPATTKDFVVFGQSSNTDGYIGYGYITDGGSLQVRFNQAITSYIRFTITYDKEE